jgi:hypothetical protein
MTTLTLLPDSQSLLWPCCTPVHVLTLQTWPSTRYKGWFIFLCRTLGHLTLQLVTGNVGQVSLLQFFSGCYLAHIIILVLQKVPGSILLSLVVFTVDTCSCSSVSSHSSLLEKSASLGHRVESTHQPGPGLRFPVFMVSSTDDEENLEGFCRFVDKLLKLSRMCPKKCDECMQKSSFCCATYLRCS